MNHLIDDEVYTRYMEPIPQVIAEWPAARRTLKDVPFGAPEVRSKPYTFRRSHQVGMQQDGLGDLAETLRSVTEYWRWLSDIPAVPDLGIVLRRTITRSGYTWRAEAGWPLFPGDPDYSVVTSHTQITIRNQPERRTVAGALGPLLKHAYGCFW